MLLGKIYKAALFSSLRYSKYIVGLQDILRYWPNEEMLKVAMKFVMHSKLDGDYLEFGVFRGANIVAAFHLAQRHGLDAMQFYAFDSFQGLPEVSGVDRGGSVDFFSRGEFSCDMPSFKRITERKGVDQRRLHLVPGWYNEVLNAETKRRLPLKKAALVWIDCDLYESTVPVLDFITDYVQNGTLLMFDDWFCFRGDPDKGEQRAFREWLAKNPSIKATQFYRFGWHGESFILNPS
jgi:hypothetical protein